MRKVQRVYWDEYNHDFREGVFARWRCATPHHYVPNATMRYYRYSELCNEQIVLNLKIYQSKKRNND